MFNILGKMPASDLPGSEVNHAVGKENPLGDVCYVNDAITSVDNARVSILTVGFFSRMVFMRSVLF